MSWIFGLAANNANSVLAPPRTPQIALNQIEPLLQSFASTSILFNFSRHLNLNILTYFLTIF